LRGAGDILLVSCFELGHQPTGLAFPAAFLRRAGFAPATLDLSVEPFDEAAAARARLVAISVPMHTALRLGVRAAERIRKLNPTSHICFLGLYAVLNAKHLLAQHGDSVLGGESEEELVRLAQRLDSGEALPAAVPSVKERLNFPSPDRLSLPTIDRYARLKIGDELRLAGSVDASRGCLHTCRHCPITPVYEGRFFVIPRDVVLADIAQQVAAGATHITFNDPDFLNGPKHSLALVRELHERWPTLTFDATIKVEHILKRPEIFPELRASGCLFVVSAFESLNDQVLEELDKGHGGADLTTAVRILRDAGIAVRPTFVAFTPWESIETRLQLFEFIDREGLIEHIDAVQYTLRLLIPPGSPLADRPAMQPHLGAFDAAAFGYRWTHPDPRMETLPRDSAQLLREAMAQGASAVETFERLFAQTIAVANAPTRVRPRQTRIGVPRVPHLTEAWFC
jgi:radical SAM superfamily enzyme YgiQ (UPF0313 family)